jgi:hypothetical protein
MKKLLLLLALVTLFACVRKEEVKKDDFLDPPKTEETKPKTRINVIDNGNAWDNFQILEVDGHHYLSNSAHGGFVHLESCPCKSK